jgi:MoxR-like ATPase
MQLKLESFDAKSNSVARDLFYTYDAIGHYRAGPTSAVRPWLKFDALGLAILRVAEPAADLTRLLPEYAAAEPLQSVVVIDEIDKAPRDFPNDLLNEIDRMYFHVPEIENVKVTARKGLDPVLVITSNSEKNLPPPFLRRCVYYDIPFPSDKALQHIVASRIVEFKDKDGDSATGPLAAGALSLFRKLWESPGLSRQPGTAELLDWMLALIQMGARTELGLRQQAWLVRKSFAALVKSEGDREPAMQVIEEWLAGS